ncbi:restriction endonuclease [Roseovarius aquimarinus]|uniref:Restriction endonuclease n=1 Tax=Roseovarius aquimarinus TaxID=1229156 RepID=A0ABW7I9A6_9RHOB
MAVPDYQTLMLPVLKLFADGKTSIADCIDDLKAQFNISEEEAAELLPSGRITRLYSRAHWARTYLGKAGLLTSPKRGYHEITDAGLKVLASKPETIDNAFLAQFEAFSEWKSQPPKEDGTLADYPVSKASTDEQTPEDAMQTASSIIDSALRDELIGALMQVSPTRFERLILDLLAAMNFGRGDLENGRMTSAGGDGGIDGIINEDALGLDAVYIQAKRYAPDNKVGRPDIQRFVGSLTGESATKGVFVTTSSFSKDARDYVERVQQRIVLIDGKKLAQLMIEHGVGVRTRITYHVKGLDEDYFSDA